MIRTLMLPVAVVAAAACSMVPTRPEPQPKMLQQSGAPAKPVAGDPPAVFLPTTTARRPDRDQGISVSRLYRENCINCHGERGQGGGAGTPSLITAEKFLPKWDRPFHEAILNGVHDRAMPAYAETMTDREIWGLVVHLRELQRDGLRGQGVGLYADSKTPHQTTVEDVVTTGKGLRTPWGVSWLPDGRMLVTNRGGEMFSSRGGELTPITGIPESTQIGQGGLMDVAVHPDYAKNGWIYLALTDPAPGDRGKGQTKIVRGKLSGNVWSGTETIFQAPPESYTGAGVHFGSRVVFDGKGHVFFAIGERGEMIKAQDPKLSVGKIYRVMEDGKLPKDNPFAGQGPVAGAVWSMGHRNPQGLAMDRKGQLWDTEHGPRGGDELNLIRPARNYGWPTHGFFINYNDVPMTVPWPKPNEQIQLPVTRWLPSIGACGLTAYEGKAFPGWKGDLIAGGLSGQNVDRFKVVDGKVVEHEELVFQLGRVRDVKTGPDGFVYVVLNDPDKIIRLVPKK